MGLLRSGNICEKSINCNSLSAIYFGIKITLDLSNSSLWMQAQLLQSCLTFVTPWTVSHQVSLPVNGIFLARILEWITTPSSRGSSWPSNQTHVSSLLDCSQILYIWATREVLKSIAIINYLAQSLRAKNLREAHRVFLAWGFLWVYI